MAQPDEPLYDFPEPSQLSKQKPGGIQRGRGSLRSISVLDRLLLTVPVWVQLSINPATALHILQREPPGTFLVRKSRTYGRSVLCLRLADNSVPSFVQQFGIREEDSTFSLETSAISFPDLPRLISFYCVSRDVLPFPLELPEAIARATSHKELESISHMGIEFWNSHLNVRGPRETPKGQKDQSKSDGVASVPLTPAPQISSVAQPDAANQDETRPKPDVEENQNEHGTTLFQEFCPITTRSPRDLDCGSGLGALCFINPLFLQSQAPLSRRSALKRSLKVRVSTEPSTFLLPPLASPPPPPLMPKKKARCKAKTQAQGQGEACPDVSQGQNMADANLSSLNNPCSEDTQLESLTENMDVQSQSEGTNTEISVPPQVQTHPKDMKTHLQIPEMPGDPPEYSDYMQPTSRAAPPLSPILSPYLCPSIPPKAPASLYPQVPSSLSPQDCASEALSLSPYQSPSPSPRTCASFSQFSAGEYHTPKAAPERAERGAEEEEEEKGERAGEDDSGDVNNQRDAEQGQDGEERMDLIIQRMRASSVNDKGSCSSDSTLEEEAEPLPPSPLVQTNGTSQ